MQGMVAGCEEARLEGGEGGYFYLSGSREFRVAVARDKAWGMCSFFTFHFRRVWKSFKTSFEKNENLVHFFGRSKVDAKRLSFIKFQVALHRHVA